MSAENYDRGLLAQPGGPNAASGRVGFSTLDKPPVDLIRVLTISDAQNNTFYDMGLLKGLDEKERLHEGAAPPPVCSQTQGDVEGVGVKAEGAPAALLSRPVRRRSWYKKRPNILASIIVIFIILGATIGGAVEGTRAKTSSKPNGDGSDASPTSSSTSGETAGVAADPVSLGEAPDMSTISTGRTSSAATPNQSL